MNRRVRSLVIVLAVVAVLAAALIFVRLSPHFKGGSSSASSSAEIDLIKTDVSKIKTLQVINRKGTYTIRGGKSYSIEGADLGGAPINSTALQSACGDAAALTATSVAAKNVPSLAPYGLSNPQGTVNVATTDGHSYNYLIGDKSPMGDGYYIAAKGKNTVYITGTEVETYFLASPWTFIDTALISLDSTKDVPNLTNVTFGGSKRAAPISINIPPAASSSSASSTAGISKSTMPYIVSTHLLANSTQLSTLEQSLAAVSATSVVSLDVSKDSLRKYGLLDPAYTFSCTVKGKTTKLLFGNAVKSPSGTSSSEDSAAAEDELYVMKEGVPVIYSVSSTAVSFYNWTEESLLDTLQFIVTLSDLKSMTVESGGKTWKFDFAGSGDSQTVTYSGKKLDMENFRNFYQNVISTSFAGMISMPAGAKLYAKVTCTYKDASKGSESMEFYSLDDQRCYWKVNGQGGLYVLKTSVDKILAEAQQVCDGKQVTAQ